MTIRQRVSRVRRLDGVAEVVTKGVELSKMVKPKFLTLTGLPASQVAFKVVRDDQGGEPEMTKEVTEGRQRRIRPVQRSSLLYVEFPDGTTVEDAEAVMAEYGLEGQSRAPSLPGRG